MDDSPSPGFLVQDSDGISSNSRYQTTSTAKVSAATKVLTRLHTATVKVKANERHRRTNSLGSFSPSPSTSSTVPHTSSTTTPTRRLVHTCSSASLASTPQLPPQSSIKGKSATSSPLSSSTSSSSTSLLSLSPTTLSTSASFTSVASSSSPRSHTRSHTPQKSVTYPYPYPNHFSPSPKPYNASESCTPLRSNSTTPKPRSGTSHSSSSSPLFQRLLQPFVRSPANAVASAISTDSATATSSLSPLQSSLPTTPINSNMALHQSPHYQNQNQSTGPSSTPGTPNTPGTPSRSERLLRDALLRDGMERHNASNINMNEPSGNPYPSTSSARMSHRRRHSEVPISSTFVSPSADSGASRRQHLPPHLTALPPQSPGVQSKTSPSVTATMGTVSSGSPSAGLKREREMERYTGSFLFRTAMSNPGAAPMSESPEPEEREDGSSGGSSSKSKSNSNRSGKGYYGGDAEGGVGGTRWRGSSADANAAAGYQHSRSASLSPSPIRRRLSGNTQQQQLPPPIDLFTPQFQLHQHQQHQHQQLRSPRSPTSQHHTPQSARHSPQLRQKDKGSPLILTPHEQVLRARLERVLEAGRVVERGERAKSLVRAAAGSDGFEESDNSAPGNEHIGRRGKSGGSSGDVRGSGSGENENEVQDEQGGWPWREGGRGSAGEASGSPAEVFGEVSRGREMSSSPVFVSGLPNTGSSLSSISPPPTAARFGSSQAQPQPTSQPQQSSTMTQPSTPSRTGFTPGHNRTRSKTDTRAASPAARANNLNSPRRNTTFAGNTPTKTPSRSMSVSVLGVPRTPVASGSRIPIPVKAEEAKEEVRPHQAGENKLGEKEDDDEELRLLTPPPTPPFTARVFSHPGKATPGIGAEYCPSPYKTSYPAGIQDQNARMRSQVRLGGGDGPRRPINAPVARGSGARRSSSCGVGPRSNAIEQRQGYLPTSSSGSGSSSPEAESEPRSPSVEGELDDADVHMHYRHHLTESHIQNHPHTLPHRPAFNARKASERCRAIEGYVSFASVEGLGEPAGAAFGDDMDENGNSTNKNGTGGANGTGGVLGAAWRRLMGVAAVSAGGGGSGAQEGVVL